MDESMSSDSSSGSDTRSDSDDSSRGAQRLTNAGLQGSALQKELQKMMLKHPDPLPADDAAVTKLYRHDCKSECCPERWSAFDSVDDEEKDLKQRTVNEPIVHRHRRKSGKWITHSFTVQCPTMRGILAEALDKYQDLDMDLEDWTFEPPYRALVHRWDRLKEIQAELVDETKTEATNALMRFLTPVLAGSVESLSLTRKTGKVEFENVWQIFAPNTLAVTNIYGVETLCRVSRYEKMPYGVDDFIWVITLEYVDWNGQMCGYSNIAKTITRFNGFQHVHSLPVYALEFHPAAEAKKAAVLARGRRFESLRGYHFLTCNENGRKVVFSEDDKAKQKVVSGRVVVDGFAYFRAQGNRRPTLRSLTDPGVTQGTKRPEPKAKKRKPVSGRKSKSNPKGFPRIPPGIPPPPPPPRGLPMPPTSADNLLAMHAQFHTGADSYELTSSVPEDAKSRKEDLGPLTDEQCMIATPWLRGMDLKTKEWGMFFIDELHDIVWNEKAFDNLVLPEEDKALTWDFVDAKRLSTNAYDDFIADKGRGTIILMFGPPGVGKTLTAEAVAEKSHAPLYAISAGILSAQDMDVEDALDQALDLCRLWGAILLLDEADVFLSARTDDWGSRNELISIFLTKLEYYQGILFLTTNRIASIDYAFQSRIDLFLPYRDLDAAARRQVWANFVKHLGESKFDISEADMDRLAEIRVNGREIKNLIKSAQLLSVGTGKRVNMERLVMLAEKRVAALQMLAEHGKQT